MLNTASCQGVIGLESSTSGNISLASYGANARLGTVAPATAGVTFSGTLTPQGTTYRVGGGGGTLTISSTWPPARHSLEMNTTGSLPAGIVILTNTNTYSGGTVLTAGELSVSSTANLGTGTLTFNGGILQVTGNGLTNLGTCPVNWPTFNGGFDIAAAGTTFTVSQLVAGTGSFTKLGSGTLVLSNTNTYSGGTVVGGGTLQLATPHRAGHWWPDDERRHARPRRLRPQPQHVRRHRRRHYQQQRQPPAHHHGDLGDYRLHWPAQRPDRLIEGGHGHPRAQRHHQQLQRRHVPGGRRAERVQRRQPGWAQCTPSTSTAASSR